MNISWLLIAVVALNLTFSTISDVCAKYWGITNNQSWLYVGMTVNLLTMFFYMYAIRLGGIAITSSVVLLITIAISVVIGFHFFNEPISVSQWVGIGLGFVAVVLISGILIPSRF